MVGAVVVRILDLLVQLTLIGLGLLLLNADVTVNVETGGFEYDSEVALIALWGAVGTLYWLGSVIAVGVSVRRSSSRDPRWLRLVELHPIVGAVQTVATFFASIVGIFAAGTMLVLRNDPNWAGWVEVVAVWTMLVSWALFHWGFARIYDRRYRRAAEPPLVFPGAQTPALADFVYFSFTNATAFSVSDVQVMSTRMRWTVVWHTTFSFFLNALIIVLAFSTIINS